MLRTVPAEVQPGREIELRKRSFVAADRCPDMGKATVMSNDHGESDVTPTESKTTRTVWKRITGQNYLSAGNDRNIMVTCTPDGNIAEIIAVNPVTGNQRTRFLYGTTLGSGGARDSAIARSDLLVAILYPDAADSADSCASPTIGRAK